MGRRLHAGRYVFSRAVYTEILLESLIYCVKEKGLEIYAWVIMSNHCHLIISAKNKNLSDIIKDFKKFTSKQIYNAIAKNKAEFVKNGF